VNIVFFGSGAFGLPTLRALADTHTLRAVVTQPDRPAGRGGKPTPTPIGAWAEAHAPTIPLFKPEKVNLPEIRDAIRALPADAWVVIAFGQKLSASLLADRFAINLHASLLPRWRGAAPINAAILAGDTLTGNAVITLADRMDAGLVLGRTQRAIPPTATAGEMHDQLAEDGPALVLEVLARHEAGTLTPEPQDESLVTIAPKLTRADARVSFAEPADRVRCRINGLSPWPGVTAGFRGEGLKLLRADSQKHDGPTPPVARLAEPCPRSDSGKVGATAPAPGTILDPAQGLVACAPGSALRLLEVQAPGKKAMPWGEFARGRSVQAGERLEDHADAPPGG
jgi:methionyl-tRNA formyltransferase